MYNNIQSESAKLTETIGTLQMELHDWESNDANKKQELDKLNAELDDVKKKLTETCSQLEEYQVKLASSVKDRNLLSEQKSEAEQNKAELKEILDDREKYIETQLGLYNNIQSEFAKLIETNITLEMELHDWKSNDASEKQELDKLNAELDDVKIKLTEKCSLLEEYEVKLSSSVEDHNLLSEQKSEAEKNTAELKEILDDREKYIDTQLGMYNNIQSESAKLTETIGTLQMELHDWESNDANKKQELDKLNAELDDVKKKLTETCSQLEEYQVKLASSVEDRNLQSEQKSKAEKNKFVLGNDVSNSSANVHTREGFQTDDPIVNECRDQLLRLRFGWIKFTQNAKFTPGFVYPADADGICRAQKVTAKGYVCDSKNPFFKFEYDIPANKKKSECILALKNLNKKFNFSYN